MPNKTPNWVLKYKPTFPALLAARLPEHLRAGLVAAAHPYESRNGVLKRVIAAGLQALNGNGRGR